MAFYLAPGERTEMQEPVSEVVTAAAQLLCHISPKIRSLHELSGLGGEHSGNIK